MSRPVALLAGSLVVVAVAACSGEGDSMPGDCPQLPLYDVTERGQPTESQLERLDTAADNFCITRVGFASTEPPPDDPAGGSGGSAGAGGGADAGAVDGGDAAP